MSDTLQRLLDAIRTRPEDDTARLVYADWLEEQGDAARAELVRVQVSRARLSAWDPERVRLQLRERALLAEHGERWRSELPELKGVTWGSFRRGLIGRASFASVEVLQQNLEALRGLPVLEGIALRWAAENDWDKIGAIEGLRSLTVHGPLLDETDMDGLAQSPLLSALTTLNLVESRMSREPFQRLLSSPHLGQLETLRVPHHLLSSLEDLVQATTLPALRELDLSVATMEELGSSGRDTETLGSAAAGHLAAWPGLAQLRSLNLSGNAISEEGLLALLSSPRAAGLKELHVRGIGQPEEVDDGWWLGQPPVMDMAAFEQATAGMSLEVLSLECGMGEESGRQLANARCLSDLKVLDLRYVFDRDDGAFVELARAPWLDTLAVLDASYGHVGELLPTLVARAPARLHTLKVVSSHYRQLEVRDIELLARSPASNGLLQLDLSYNGLRAEHLDALGQARALQSLLSLRVAEYRTPEPEVVDRLADSPLGQRLLHLELGEGSHRDRLPVPKPQKVVRGSYRGSLYDL
jgi:uncharacterized protein (TIGR02996 family)